jgi:phosphoenolpyruvate synthase/pyruvate phosphate dikinase
MGRRWVYLFREIEEAEADAGDWDAVRRLLGGKGANLAEMARIGMPVPPGFTVTTEACIAYLKRENGLPQEIWEAEKEPCTGSRRLREDLRRCFQPAPRVLQVRGEGSPCPA